jgi:ATP-dependent Clp protease ATP-binding subunit ClpA
MESRRRGREVAIEHVLLALLMEEDGMACRVLTEADVTLDAVVARLPEPFVPPVSNQIPFTLEAKWTLEHAERRATRFGHRMIGTEHLLSV